MPFPETEPCLDGRSHHWMIGQPRVAYSRPGNMGDLVEVTEQSCKHCHKTRVNQCVLIDRATSSVDHQHLEIPAEYRFYRTMGH